MTPSKYVQPELGRHSLSVLLVLLLVSAALFSDYCLGSATRTTPGPVSFTNLNLYSFFLVGLIYGWTAAGSWLLSCIERRYLRWGLQLGLTVVLARILQAMREDEWMRFFSSLGGLVFSQTIIFHLIGMPRWKISRLADRDSPNLKDEPTRQFGIGDILACTTCIAFLLAIMIRYQPSGVGSTSYWLPLIAFLTVAPLSAASMMKAVLGSRRRIEQIAWVLLSIGTTILCATDLGSIPADRSFEKPVELTGSLAIGCHDWLGLRNPVNNVCRVVCCVGERRTHRQQTQKQQTCLN
jgi:hypothetical protein